MKTKAKKLYTFNVTCSFSFQFTFSDSEVMRDPGGSAKDYLPTDKALHTLEKRMAETIGNDFSVGQLEVNAESDDLLGISRE